MKSPESKLHFCKRKLAELQPKADIKLADLVNPEAVAAGGAIDYIAADPVVCGNTPGPV